MLHRKPGDRFTRKEFAGGRGLFVDRKARVARQVSAVAVSREKVGGLLGVADSRTAFSQTAANRRTTAEDQSPSDRTFDADCSATGRRSVRDLVADYITCVADFIPTHHTTTRLIFKLLNCNGFIQSVEVWGGARKS